MPCTVDIEECRKVLENSDVGKVALVYHLKIEDFAGYENWLRQSSETGNVRRLFRVKADPAPREGMLIDEIVIDEYPSVQAACGFISSLDNVLRRFSTEYAVLALAPEASATFFIVKLLSWIVRVFRGAAGSRATSATWEAENTAIWPDARQMQVAIEQNLDAPLFVYNLNKYKPVAAYRKSGTDTAEISGQEAYNRYARIAGFELLRRGAYPVYGGRPLCVFASRQDCILADCWDHFIFVRYRRRRDLLAIIDSDEFRQGEVHRDAGLERAAIFLAK